MSRPRTQKSPAPGLYTGTVNGHPAMFVVLGGECPTVDAWWLEQPYARWRPRAAKNVWEIHDGRFTPLDAHDRQPVRCTFRVIQALKV